MWPSLKKKTKLDKNIKYNLQVNLNIFFLGFPDRTTFANKLLLKRGLVEH